jgi:hypothetical protein
MTITCIIQLELMQHNRQKRVGLQPLWAGAGHSRAARCGAASAVWRGAVRRGAARCRQCGAGHGSVAQRGAGHKWAEHCRGRVAFPPPSSDGVQGCGAAMCGGCSTASPGGALRDRRMRAGLQPERAGSRPQPPPPTPIGWCAGVRCGDVRCQWVQGGIAGRSAAGQPDANRPPPRPLPHSQAERYGAVASQLGAARCVAVRCCSAARCGEARRSAVHCGEGPATWPKETC